MKLKKEENESNFNILDRDIEEEELLDLDEADQLLNAVN